MSVLTPSDVKPHLGLTGVALDDELQDFIDAAEAALTVRVGPLAATARTVRIPGSGSSCLALPTMPVTAVASITGKSGTLAAVDWFNGGAGVVYSESVFSEAYYDVAYTAGHVPLPADLRKAAMELVRHLWKTQRGVGSARGASPDESAPGSAHTFPYRVQQLIAPYLLPGFA